MKTVLLLGIGAAIGGSALALWLLWIWTDGFKNFGP